MNSIKIRKAKIQDIILINQLITTIFEQDIKIEMTEIGQREFIKFIAPDALKSRLAMGSQVWVGESNSHIVGMIEFIYHSHITLYFVDSAYRGLGLGKALFNQVKTVAKENITANSSAYALPIYLKLGFEQNGQPVSRNGITAYPVIFTNNLPLQITNYPELLTPD
jgi:GNAT superfamily N-acetyltransferase